MPPKKPLPLPPLEGGTGGAPPPPPPGGKPPPPPPPPAGPEGPPNTVALRAADL